MRGEKQGPGEHVRKLDKSHTEIILRVQQYFEIERQQKLFMEIAQVVKGTSNIHVHVKQ